MSKKTTCIIVLSLLLAGLVITVRYNQPAGARTITVPNDFVTIQAAINNATNEDTVFVRSGTYNEKVVVNKTVSLIGESMETTVIRYSTSFNDETIINVTADGATVKNFSIVNTGIEAETRGILVKDAHNCIISRNNFTEHIQNGIFLNNASYAIITDNVFTNNGLTVQQSYENTIQNNTLNGKPIVYLENVENEIVEVATAGQVILMRCSNVTVQHGNFSNTNMCIQLRESNSCRLVNNYLRDSQRGIVLGLCLNTLVSRNNIANCSSSGILIMGYTNYSVVSENTMSGNLRGISLLDSSNTRVYHNNFINNSQKPYIPFVDTVGEWDDEYPSGGNYWSEYNGTDLFKGIFQNVTGSDGIGDMPYTIRTNNKDNYPLMGPFGDSTSTGSNVTVFPTIDVGMIYENITAPGITTANATEAGPQLPPNSTLVGQYYNITTTAKYAGTITVRIIYDDSNMTLDDENSLRLLQWSGCDVTGPTPSVPDGIVNMRDIGYFCSKFMTTPSNPDWDPRCDVTGPTPGVPDGAVNMRDIGEACADFMGTNSWVNITLYVDTDNNVIYGETTHFSMFGVTRW